MDKAVKIFYHQRLLEGYLNLFFLVHAYAKISKKIDNGGALTG